MKNVLFCVALLTLLTLPSSAMADRILLLGDSLSAAYKIPYDQGWAQLLKEELEQPQNGGHKLINASVSGETSGGGLARLPALLEEHKPDWVIIELGGNDGLRGYPLQVLRGNLQRIAALVTDSGAKPILFGIRIPANYGKRYNDAFSAIFTDVSEQVDAPLLDLYIEELANNPDLMLDDGIHPSLEAQPLIQDHVAAFLSPILN